MVRFVLTLYIVVYVRCPLTGIRVFNFHVESSARPQSLREQPFPVTDVRDFVFPPFVLEYRRRTRGRVVADPVIISPLDRTVINPFRFGSIERDGDG